MAALSCLTALGSAVLTFNSGMAIYRSNGDAGSIVFVVFSYLYLVALVACLRIYKDLDYHSPHRQTIKAAVWTLTSLLTVMFSYKVAEIMPLAVKIVVWAMAAATTFGGFYAFFIHEDKPYQAVPAAPALRRDGTNQGN